MVDSSNFNDHQFDAIVEGVETLIDESFDLSPDIVRVGLVVYRCGFQHQTGKHDPALVTRLAYLLHSDITTIR